MTGSLLQFLFRKKTLAVVGVVVVVLVCVRLWLIGDSAHISEQDREKIEIVERYLKEEIFVSYRGAPVTLTGATVTQNGDDILTVEGYTYARGDWHHVTFPLVKHGGGWAIYNYSISPNESFWDRIKEYVTSFLP